MGDHVTAKVKNRVLDWSNTDNIHMYASCLNDYIFIGVQSVYNIYSIIKFVLLWAVPLLRLHWKKKENYSRNLNYSTERLQSRGYNVSTH